MKLQHFKLINIFTLLFILLSFSGCVKDLEEQEIYQRPGWLEGKLFDQIKNENDLSTFITCLQKTGYDTLLNTSGSFTVIAPTDDAFIQFFQNHPAYNSVDDISADELKALVEYQIIYNAWTRDQFKSLDVSGWIDPGSQSYNEPRGYKRQTIYREGNKTYPVKRGNNFFRIVEPEESSQTKIAYNPVNKYVPVFFQEYLNIFDLSSNDFSFYFDRAFESEHLYYSGAVIGTEIPAENGFIYKSDKVVLPLPNAETILEEGSQDHTYNTFLKMIHEFSELTVDFEATFNQPAAKQGLGFDSLYNVKYPSLVFNINSESTGNSNLTIREHYGLLAPTDDAFDDFVASYINEGWGDLEHVPKVIKEVIINTHMAENVIYPKDFNSGFRNGVEDMLFLDEEDIVQKVYGSNCSFLGLEKVIVPRAFQSVSRPVYLERDYEIMLKAIERTKILSAIKDKDSEFVFYLPPDISIGLQGGDSSLFINYLDTEKTKYDFRAFNISSNRNVIFSTNLLKKIILNQIGLRTPKGIANKEFIETLAGNYIIVDNMAGIVQGTAPSTYGYSGSDPIDIKPVLYEKETDNGETYKVNGFFSFTNRTFWTLFTTRYPNFQSLLRKAGLYDVTHNDYPFLTRNEYYTVFIPSDSVIASHQLDTLSKEDLKEVLQYHFIKGELIFTDGSSAEGQYKTTRVDESSTDLLTKYSEIHIRPTPDVIEVLDKNGALFLSIPEKNKSTNIMTTIDSDESSDQPYESIVTGIVHEIDKLLIKDILHEN